MVAIRAGSIDFPEPCGPIIRLSGIPDSSSGPSI